MTAPVRMASVVSIALCVGVGAAVLAQRAPAAPSARVNPAEVTGRIVAAARAVLTSLDEPGRGKVQFPFDSRRGEGTIELRSAAVFPRMPDGGHRLSFRNTHRRDVSVYLANALVPRSDRIAVTAQTRDAEQRDLTIDYLVRTRSEASPPVWLLGGSAGALLLAALMTRPSHVCE
jgi:hypothetical protein